MGLPGQRARGPGAGWRRREKAATAPQQRGRGSRVHSKSNWLLSIRCALAELGLCAALSNHEKLARAGFA
jgi:hypothetical protein